jgi:hypothetical protein
MIRLPICEWEFLATTFDVSLALKLRVGRARLSPQRSRLGGRNAPAIVGPDNDLRAMRGDCVAWPDGA